MQSHDSMSAYLEFGSWLLALMLKYMKHAYVSCNSLKRKNYILSLLLFFLLLSLIMSVIIFPSLCVCSVPACGGDASLPVITKCIILYFSLCMYICLQKAHDMLKKAWDAEGSPFKGTPFDPSRVQISGNF